MAGATHPDYEGERGPELTLMPGYGGFTTGDEGVFRPTEQLPRADIAPPPDAFSGSFAFNAAAGYRFAPYVSAGLEGGYQALSSANVYSSLEATYEPSDRLRAFHVGAYGRLYPMAFFNGSRNNPRVFFESWTDRRRFEPWLSLGVNFTSVNRRRSYASVGYGGDSYTSMTTNYLGVPVAVGLDYRLLPRLALGLTFGVTPLVAGGTSVETFEHRVTTGSDTRTTTETSYAPAAASNATFFAGLGVRYTFTYW